MYSTFHWLEKQSWNLLFPFCFVIGYMYLCLGGPSSCTVSLKSGEEQNSGKKSKISCCKILQNYWDQAIELLNALHLNGHTLGFLE